ncbi:MAG: hypothetical protein KGJ41_12420 [Rhodospirillales bacterium]|nr:hypothetical protein [Rhodospirillales bacterium]MDE2199814.1 hypothetical protein [Rhodospirillales bacterium]MDE2575399.1 hypothetical protein [Rhodospirillales bacterium]
MAQHKFAVGEMVDFRPGARDGNVPQGKYKIQRLLPSETSDMQYRVKHAVDGHERVVPESKLTGRSGVLG